MLTRNGKPVALIVGVEGMDKEQLQLGSSDKFWKLIEKRRKDKIVSRVELEQRLKKKWKSRKKTEEISVIVQQRSLEHVDPDLQAVFSLLYSLYNHC